jgi:hypothetical protein
MDENGEGLAKIILLACGHGFIAESLALVMDVT